MWALQFSSPEIDILMTKCGQVCQTFNVLKPFCIAFDHLFPIKSGRGPFIREGAYIRIDMV